MEEVLNDLFDYEGLKIYQSKDGFKFSLDSILLAEYVDKIKDDNKVLDLCTGNAVVPLILSTKTKALIDAFEIQESIYNLAIKSIKYNKLDNQINVICDNVNNIDLYYKNKKYDIITCNPPFFKINEQGYINENNSKAIARHEIEISLEDIFKISSRYLDEGGRLYLVHRATRLDEIIILGNKYKLNVKEICFIKTKENISPRVILIKCVKNAKLGVKINKEVCINNLSTYQNIFREEK